MIEFCTNKYINCMKISNQRQGTQDLIPLTLNVVNLDGLKLVYRRNSERYSKQKPLDFGNTKKKLTTSLKRPQLLTNRVYFKRKKQREDQLYFSDNRIKLVSGVQPTSMFYQINESKISIDDPEFQIAEPKFKQKLYTKPKSQQQDAKAILNLSQVQYTQLQKNQQNISTSKSLQKNKEITGQKREAKTKEQKRRGFSTLKISHSYKNCQKFNIQQRKPHQIDHRLDGWAVQSPLYDAEKKLDITDYAQKNLDDSQNFLSQRTKLREEAKHMKKINILSYV